MIFGVRYSMTAAYEASEHSVHLRYWTSEWRFFKNYRQDFVELADELSDKKYNNCKVLGTFDLQVYSWWTTFGKGTLYIPFPQLSNASDDEIETRFIRFCQIIG